MSEPEGVYQQKLKIQGYLSWFINEDRLPICEELLAQVAMWEEWMDFSNMGASASTVDWHVLFLKWALQGRAAEFVAYAKAIDTDIAEQALKGINRVYNFYWPHTASTGYVFAGLWGWLQVELEKPGESRPLSIAEQKKRLTEYHEARGATIEGWEYDGAGGVFAKLRKT